MLEPLFKYLDKLALVNKITVFLSSSSARPLLSVLPIPSQSTSFLVLILAQLVCLGPGTTRPNGVSLRLPSVGASFIVRRE